MEKLTIQQAMLNLEMALDVNKAFPAISQYLISTVGNQNELDLLLDNLASIQQVFNAHIETQQENLKTALEAEQGGELWKS
ncbi:hypothetical protein A1D22_00750 [Pasteurellaceae bacterium LFhippo2]|nr:hypothetical protein [Pasteurellaceae bacterium LFhippo2]